jgi:hypothetical protein
VVSRRWSNGRSAELVGYMAKNAYDDAEQDGLKARIYGFARSLAGNVSSKQRLIVADGENEAKDS